MPMFGRYWPARRDVEARRSGLVPGSVGAWMDRVMQDPFAFLAEAGPRPGPWAGMGLASLPLADVAENEKSYVVKMDLPGFSKDGIEITVHPNEGIEVRGRRDEMVEQRDDARGYLRRERRMGSVQRFIPFPGPVVEDQITARYDAGVLAINLPKSEAGGPAFGRRVSIS